MNINNKSKFLDVYTADELRYLTMMSTKAFSMFILEATMRSGIYTSVTEDKDFSRLAPQIKQMIAEGWKVSEATKKPKKTSKPKK